MANGINANIVHRWRKLARGNDAKAATKTGEFIALPLTMAPTLVAAHHIEVGGCGLARRIAPQCDHDVHHLAEQRYHRIRSLDPRPPRVSRWPWRRIPMDTPTI